MGCCQTRVRNIQRKNIDQIRNSSNKKTDYKQVKPIQPEDNTFPNNSLLDQQELILIAGSCKSNQDNLRPKQREEENQVRDGDYGNRMIILLADKPTLDSPCLNSSPYVVAYSSDIPTKVEYFLQRHEDILVCTICFVKYDANNLERTPMMVCMNQHTFCLKCLRDCSDRGNSFCPIDRLSYDITRIQKNRMIIYLLTYV